MSLHFNLNNSVKKVKSIYANVGGNVKKIKSAWVSNGSTGVRRVYSSAPESVLVTNVREAKDNNVVMYSEDGIVWNTLSQRTILGFLPSTVNTGRVLSKIIYWKGVFVCLCVKYVINQSPTYYYNFKYYIRVSENLEDWETLQEFSLSITGTLNNSFYIDTVISNTYFDVVPNDNNDFIIVKIPIVYDVNNSPYDSNITFGYYKLNKINSQYSLNYFTSDTIKMGLPHEQNLNGDEGYLLNDIPVVFGYGIVYFGGRYVTMLENPFTANSVGFYLTQGNDLSLWEEYTKYSYSGEKKSYPSPLGVFNFNGNDCLILAWQGSNNNVVLSYTFDTSFDREQIMPLLNNGSEVVIFNNVTSSDYSSEGGMWRTNHINLSKFTVIDGRYFVTFSIYRNSFVPKLTRYSFELQCIAGVVTVKRQFSEPFDDIVKFNNNYYVTDASGSSTQSRLKQITNFNSGNDFTYTNIGVSGMGNPLSLTVKE